MEREKTGMSKYIHSLGVELEGGISGDGYHKCEQHFKVDLIDDKFQMGTDGTANSKKTQEMGNQEWRYWDFNNNNFQELFDMINYCYEQGWDAGPNCGFHMHIKFNGGSEAMKKYLTLFSYPSFQKKFISRYVKDFGKNEKYMKRLNATYCVAEWSPRLLDLQEKNIGDSRRTAINLSAWARHRTIEIRLFPAQDSAEEAINSVKWVIRNIDEVIDEMQETEQPMFRVSLKNMKEFASFQDDAEKTIKVHLDRADISEPIVIKPKKVTMIKDMSQFIAKKIEDHLCELVKQKYGEDPRDW